MYFVHSESFGKTVENIKTFFKAKKHFKININKKQTFYKIPCECMKCFIEESSNIHVTTVTE